MPRVASLESRLRPIIENFARDLTRALLAHAPAASSPDVARSGGRGKRTRGLNPELVYKVLKQSKGGVAVGELAQKLGAQKSRVGAALKKLRDGKRAKIVGVKRNARWLAS